MPIRKANKIWVTLPDPEVTTFLFALRVVTPAPYCWEIRRTADNPLELVMYPDQHSPVVILQIVDFVLYKRSQLRTDLPGALLATLHRVIDTWSAQYGHPISKIRDLDRMVTSSCDESKALQPPSNNASWRYYSKLQ